MPLGCPARQAHPKASCKIAREDRTHAEAPSPRPHLWPAPRSSPSPPPARPTPPRSSRWCRHHPPALPGGPLHRVRRRLHRPDQSGEGVTLPPTPLLPAGGTLPGNTGDVFDAPLELQRRLQGRPQRPPLLRAHLRPAALGRHPLRRRQLPAAAAAAAGLALRRQHGRPEDLPDHRRPRLRRDPERQALRRRSAPSGSTPRPASPSSTTTRSTPARSGASATSLGAAYERPEIALRVSLTYYSKIAHDLYTDRAIVPFDTGPSRRGHETDVDTPQSAHPRLPDRRRAEDAGLRLVRWVDWSEFQHRPAALRGRRRGLIGAPRPLVDYDDDWWTYTLGMGRQLTDADGRLALRHLRAERRRRDDLARALRRAHLGDRLAQLRHRPDGPSPAASPTASSATPTTSCRPTSTTATSGAPGRGSATPSDVRVTPPRAARNGGAPSALGGEWPTAASPHPVCMAIARNAPVVEHRGGRGDRRRLRPLRQVTRRSCARRHGRARRSPRAPLGKTRVFWDGLAEGRGLPRLAAREITAFFAAIA